ncbi:probable elongation factor 1-delta [Anoplophora glabripennis]|uniref:Elongation factor 1-delta n=1 Tax=Anoplophora glabripennis TaxID=217634 RepID=V5GCH1_ANOGL|nr:probable elongation factor 1-delta [Anoplophora glabripennis]
MTKYEHVQDIWLTKKIYEDAENAHYEGLAKAALTPLAGEVAKARQKLIESRDTFTTAVASIDTGAIKFMEKKVVEFEKSMNDVLSHLKSLDDRISSIERHIHQSKSIHEIDIAAAPQQEEEEDDGVDLFASDSEEESEAVAKVREERLAAYAAKKSNKPQLIAKSNVILDIKPWDDETDMTKMEEHVRKIKCDGLLWGAAKLVPLAYGIHKLQISCVVEDEKVSIDWLTEKLQEIEDYIQSVDIAAFNKI